MAGPKLVERRWVEALAVGEVQLRCHFQRQAKEILQFTVQLEMFCEGEWRAVVRYDNAHGFCHRDTIHPDGSQEKTPVYIGDLNETFTFAIRDLKSAWKSYRDRFRREMQS